MGDNEEEQTAPMRAPLNDGEGGNKGVGRNSRLSRLSGAFSKSGGRILRKGKGTDNGDEKKTVQPSLVKPDVIQIEIQSTKTKTEALAQGHFKIAGQDIDFPGVKHKFTVYVIEVRGPDGITWILEKTYTDFSNLHKTLKQKFPGMSDLVTRFPKKKFWGSSLEESTVEERRKFFQAYLQAMLQLQPRPRDVNDFLELEKHTANRSSGLGREPRFEDFELIKLLGKGSFGKVYLCRIIATDQVYAMKVLQKSEVKKRKQVEHTKTELRVMASVDHPFIVKLLYAFQTQDKLFMVSEFMVGGELFFHLKKMRMFTGNMVRIYSAEIALALEYLHRQDIIYRDLKPENVLLDETGHVKITDFGLSRENVKDEHDATTFCGTPEYLSPEMILHRRNKAGYGKAIDWWGLGTLMYEMFSGWPPYYDRNLRIMCDKILTQELTFPARLAISDEAKDIISGFLERDPEKRLGIVGAGFEEVKNHPFYESLDWDKLYRKEIDPPFKPHIDNDPVKFFDKDFTTEPVNVSVVDWPQEEDEDGNLVVGEAVDDTFDDFTYVRDGDNVTSKDDEIDTYWGTYRNLLSDDEQENTDDDDGK